MTELRLIFAWTTLELHYFSLKETILNKVQLRMGEKELHQSYTWTTLELRLNYAWNEFFFVKGDHSGPTSGHRKIQI